MACGVSSYPDVIETESAPNYNSFGKNVYREDVKNRRNFALIQDIQDFLRDRSAELTTKPLCLNVA
jgi:hypothetical protein